MSAPEPRPADVVLRQMRPADLEAMHGVLRDCEVHDRIPIVTTLDLFRHEVCSDPVDPATDVVVAERGGVVVGYAYTYHLPSEEREERCYVIGNVAPAHRRCGIGTLLIRWTLQRAEQQLVSSGRSLPRFIRADQHDHVVGAHALYRSVGMVPIRFNEELLRPLGDEPAVELPDGVHLVDWPLERSEELRVVKNTAFVDHWGSTPTSVEHWRQMTEEIGSRLDLSSAIVDDDGAIVALCLVKRFPDDDELLGRREAWIDKLATLREWRGRGLATALIAESLRRFRADGLTHAAIGVDSANPSGAARLYRSLGFVDQHRTTTSQLEV